jgi:SpoVK/Ycf46/Vps4 family AAA+-type ATPase
MPLVRVDEVGTVDAPHLNEPEWSAIETFLQQRLNATVLAGAGLEPPKSLLLMGPPGVGKTLTARFVARELGLPLIDIELPAVVSSFLGKTGQNLRQLLDYARAAPAVLLLDEFDALAKRRDDPSDIGELKRLVNVLLIELERWPVESVLIAATNHPQLLDPAALRRFDFNVNVELPTIHTRLRILEAAIETHGLSVDESVLNACALAMDGMTGADIVATVERAARSAIVSDVDVRQLLTQASLELLSGREKTDSDARMAFAAVASEQLGLSNREIAKLLNVSHPTVSRLIRDWRTRERHTRKPNGARNVNA